VANYDSFMTMLASGYNSFANLLCVDVVVGAANAEHHADEPDAVALVAPMATTTSSSKEALHVK
jgi:hypothetical protein